MHCNALPALRAWFSVRTEQDIQSCNELKRAKGPADNSHARKGVVRVAYKMRAEGPALDLHFRPNFFMPSYSPA